MHHARIASSPSENYLERLLAASQHLIDFVQRDGTPADRDNIFDFEAYISRKADLMNGFEKEAQNLLNSLSTGAPDASSAQDVLAGEVRRIREALRVTDRQRLSRAMMRQADAAPELEMGTERSCH
jgi:hypothetical protein